MFIADSNNNTILTTSAPQLGITRRITSVPENPIFTNLILGVV